MQHAYENVLRHIVVFLQGKLEGSPEIDENAHFTDDLHVGSLLIFAIVEDLEETYEIVIPLELLYKQKIQTVAQLAKEVTRLTTQN